MTDRKPHKLKRPARVVPLPAGSRNVRDELVQRRAARTIREVLDGGPVDIATVVDAIWEYAAMLKCGDTLPCGCVVHDLLEDAGLPCRCP